MSKVFLENLYSPLLLAHLFATFVLVGSMTHDLLIVIKFLRGKFGRQKLEWFYVRVSLWSYAIVYILGALIYPAYRMFFVYYMLRRSFQPSQEKDKLYLYVPLCLLLNVIVWYKVVVGCYLTLLKGSWS
ncbi:MAG: hypothetical protein ACYTAO_08990 [Planctomycetota bacterium]|jgi:hypothetical protein